MKNPDPGPRLDPVRQQGREISERLIAIAEWYETTQWCDRSRAGGRARVYHCTYRTSSGHTPDQHFEQMAAVAREYEEAGIDLGWGYCRGNAESSPQREMARRHGLPRRDRVVKLGARGTSAGQ
jgi:hypothetical protein